MRVIPAVMKVIPAVMRLFPVLCSVLLPFHPFYAPFLLPFHPFYAESDTSFWPLLTVFYHGPLLARVPEVYLINTVISAHFCPFLSVLSTLHLWGWGCGTGCQGVKREQKGVKRVNNERK